MDLIRFNVKVAILWEKKTCYFFEVLVRKKQLKNTVLVHVVKQYAWGWIWVKTLLE